jgi:hypothetical protein
MNQTAAAEVVVGIDTHKHIHVAIVISPLGMRFGGILRGNNPATLDAWLTDVQRSGFSALRRFAQILNRDIDAVRNATREEWSNGQTEG